MKHPIFVTTPEVSKRMSNVSLKDGDSERALALAIWHLGLRYRKNYKELPGSPDIALIKHKIAIFVDGEFWHGHNWVARKEKLKTNKSYWIEKIEENIARDRKNDKLLCELGWTPIHFWEKDVKKNIDFCIRYIFDVINKGKSPSRDFV